MNSEDGNAPPMSEPASVADISASMDEPEAVPPLTPPQAMIQPGVPENTELLVMVPPTPAQVPLPPRVGGLNGSVAMLGRRSGNSDRASRRQQDRDNVTHIDCIQNSEVLLWRIT